MRSKIIIVALGILFIVTLTMAQNPGAEKMVLDGGNRGKVPFPHKKHQEVLTDCNICHSVFDMESGIIEKMKAEGKLKQKQVMNVQCTKCHKAQKQEGKPTGPTTCSKCHVREE